MPKIVLIDDDQLVLETITLALELAGHSVAQYDNAQKAIECLGREAPDVVITDIFMPDTDGLEVIRYLRRSYPGLPIIAISGERTFHPIDYLNAAEAMGAAASLRKPFDPDELDALVNRLLGTASA